MSDTDRAWRQWAEADPYFAVLSHPRFSEAAGGEHRDEFFETGRDFVAERLARIEQVFGPLARGRALDFGCGVGRVTVSLADAFDQVVALDVAEPMLAEARRNSAEIDNIIFALSDDQLSAASGRYDLVFTVMVLQHIPVRRGLKIIAELLERVAPAGVASLHLCTDRRDSWGKALHYRALTSLPGLQGLTNKMRGRAFGAPVMEMNPYPLKDVLDLALDRGFERSELRFEPHGRFETAHLLLKRNG